MARKSIIADAVFKENADGSKIHADGKDTNPKDGIGVRKWRQFCTVPFTVIWYLGVAMLEGALKYGRHNYRVSKVRSSVYVDAAKGHLDCYWEGEYIDPESRLPHLVKAMASLAVLFDAHVQGQVVDDRPPHTNIAEVQADLQSVVDFLMDKYKDPVPPYTEISHGKKE